MLKIMEAGRMNNEHTFSLSNIELKNRSNTKAAVFSLSGYEMFAVFNDVNFLFVNTCIEF